MTNARRPLTAISALLGAAVLAFVAIGTGRAVAAVLIAAALVIAFALALQASEDAKELIGRLGEWGLTLLPAALVLWFSFNGGGYFAGSQAFAAVLLAIVLSLRVAIAREPFGGWSVAGAIAASALALFAVWLALSASWSDAPGRALLELDRALLYLLVLVLYTSIPRTRQRIGWMLRAIAAAIVLVCAIGVITRVAPDVWPIAPDVQQGRLSYPLTYWNATGLLAALGAIICFHITSSEREPATARVLAAAALPLLACTLYFTFSRGAIAVTAGGLVLYTLIARPRAFITGAMATLPVSAVAAVKAYDANLLASDNPTTAAATTQGHDVAVTLALCIAAAAALRLVLVPVDRRLVGVRLPARLRRPLTLGAWGGAAVLAATAFFALGGPDATSKQYDRFVKGNDVRISGDLRSRLTDTGNNRRIDQWRVATRAYDDDRFRGFGAGTYENEWNRRRPVFFAIRDAHSLYVETLGELGIVGMLLLGVSLLVLIAGSAARARGRDRYVYAAVAAVAAAWAVRAGVDWDWEMPALTVPVFALGGSALAASERGLVRARRLTLVPRAVIAVGLPLIAVIPALVAVSQYRLERASAELDRGDCVKASDDARASLDAVSFRAEPEQILAYCEAHAGNGRAALDHARLASARDPRNWRYTYDVAIMQALTGIDPRATARLARRQNPLEPQTRGLVVVFARPKAERRAIARRAINGR